MDKKLLPLLAERLHPLQSIILVFAGGVDGIRLLSVMMSQPNRQSGVFFRTEDEMALNAVRRHGIWGGALKSRQVVMRSNRFLTEDWFADLAVRGIERITPHTPSFLNALNSSRERIRTEARVNFQKNILDPFEKEVGSWGLTLECTLVEEPSLRGVRFQIINSHEGRHIKSYYFDCWSGNFSSSLDSSGIPTSGSEKTFCPDQTLALQVIKEAFEKDIARVFETA